MNEFLPIETKIIILSDYYRMFKHEINLTEIFQ